MARTVRDIMTEELVTVSRDLPVTDAAKLMVEHHVGALPVVEGASLWGS